MKKNQIAKKLDTDIYLFLLTPLVVFSGVILHITTYIENNIWLDYQIWTKIHFFSSIPMYILIYKHIKIHLSWYKKN